MIIFLLWYGFIYYVIFLFLTFITTLFLFRLFYMNVFYRIDLIGILLKYVVSFFVFFSLFSLTVLYYILDFFATFQICYFFDEVGIFFFDYYSFNYLLSVNALNLINPLKAHDFTEQASQNFTSEPSQAFGRVNPDNSISMIQ